MIKLSKSDIDNLEFINHGGFGNIYRDGDFVYKIYMDNFLNPSLVYRPLKIKRLKYVDKKIKYSDLIKDVIFLDGRFRGVVLPFYDGKNLSNLVDCVFEDRINISYQLVRNCEELLAHFIYPRDFKLDNMMYVDGEVKLIDLDDCLTKVCFRPHIIDRVKSVMDLDVTIKLLLKEHEYLVPLNMREYIDRFDYSISNSLDDIISYLDEKSRVFNYIFISDNSDLVQNISLLKDSKSRVVYVTNKYSFEDYVCDKLMNYNKLGFSIYDVIPNIDITKYLNDVLYDEAIDLRDSPIVIKKFT